MVVLPARAYKTQGQGIGRRSCKDHLHTHLRFFTSLKELNERIRVLLELHNSTSFKGRDYSRQQQFDEMEKDALTFIVD